MKAIFHFCKKEFFVILILAYCVRGDAQTWNLVWSDEFDSGSVNTANWTYNTGGGGWGNNELEYYTNRTENAQISNGNLLIIAKQESYNGSNYTSARLATQGLQSFTYGKIEARIKLPVGKGMWPAFWTLGNNIAQVSWPECGEIDIMENINGTPTIYGTMHWYDNGNAQYGGNISCDLSQYHVYSVEWSSDSIKWFLDDKQYCTGNIANNINSTGAFHLPFFIILNLAVGGNWPGNPNSSTQFPDTMYVDYVRVYESTTDVVADDRGYLPDHFVLSQNYPDPFNPSTTLLFGLPTRSHVRLVVYNIVGQTIAELVNKDLEAGWNRVVWNAKVGSGLYFYRIEAVSLDNTSRNFVQVKKMLLLK